MMEQKFYVENLNLVSNKTGAAHELALSDWMDFCILLFDREALIGNGLDGYYSHVRKCGAEHPEYTAMALHWLNDVSDAMDRGTWLDLFGTLYEAMYLSKGKASSTGQFYTPGSVCDLMADIAMKRNNQQESKRMRVADCAAGSGRLLLSHYMNITRTDHAAGKQYYYEATDSDPMACKQCALNMMAHGLVGVVKCQNSLTLDTPKVVYHVNEVRYPINSGYYSIRTEYPGSKVTE